MLLCPWGFSRQEYWNGLPCPLPRDLATEGLNPGLPHFRRILYRLSHQERTLLPGKLCLPCPSLTKPSAFTSKSLSQGVGQNTTLFFEAVSPQKCLIWIKSSDVRHSILKCPPFPMVPTTFPLYCLSHASIS